MFTKDFFSTRTTLYFQQSISSISSISYIFSYYIFSCYKVIAFTEDKNNFDLNIEKLQQHKKAMFFKNL